MADRNDPLAQANLGSKPAILRDLGKHRDIDAPIDHGSNDVRPVSDLDANLDFRVEAPE